MGLDPELLNLEVLHASRAPAVRCAQGCRAVRQDGRLEVDAVLAGEVH